MFTRTPAPWHLWLLGVAALLWHIVGAADYVATQYEYGPYVTLFPAEFLAYFGSLPAWVDAAWAIGVWGGLLGAVLLLMRERGAVLALVVAALAMLVATIWMIFVSDPSLQSVTGMDGVWVMVGASAVPVGLWLYARWLKIAQVLG